MTCIDVNLISRVQGFGGHHEIGHASHGGVVGPVFLVRKHLHLRILTLFGGALHRDVDEGDLITKPGQSHIQAEGPVRVERRGWCGKVSPDHDPGARLAGTDCADPAWDPGGSNSHSEVFDPSCC